MGAYQRGGRQGRGGFDKRGKKRGSFRDQGPPESVTEVGTYLHSAEGDLVVKLTINKIPYNNAFVYLENKSNIGKIDEIFGLVNNPYFSVKLNEGFNSKSFEKSQRLFIDPSKLLPLERFLPALHDKKAGLSIGKKKGQNTNANKNFNKTSNRGFSRGASFSRGFSNVQNKNTSNRGKFGPTNKFRN